MKMPTPTEVKMSALDERHSTPRPGEQGFDIATVSVWQVTDQGRPHRVAKYILMSSGGVQ